ncbi:MAG TPA: sulfite exporter TauE/SafE family protein [candidate division Zixibacteria bacterium]|nr:sulfite exporter TauE/SafE family protein [candidate division Zixibacteria bacterium]
MNFPISGVETYWWLPVVVAFVISFFTSMGGVSGAFLLLPFQVSILGFAGPAVSPTNLVYNIVAIPGGVYRFIREQRMVWPLTWIIIIGTLPGIFLGAVIRIKFLPDPISFKFFAGLVLVYIGTRLLLNIFDKSKSDSNISMNNFSVTEAYFNFKHTGFRFNETEYRTSSTGILFLSFIVGIIGGTYGIGGGAIIAPFLVAVCGLPVFAVAGPALTATFVCSIAGVVFYTLIAPYFADTGLVITPDWLLGFMFGLGGLAGIYAGARLQKYIPARLIKIILVVCILFVAGKYIVGFFW